MLMNPIKNHIHITPSNDFDNMRYVHKADDNNVHMHKMQKITMPIRALRGSQYDHSLEEERDVTLV